MSHAIYHSRPLGDTAWRRQAYPRVGTASHLHAWRRFWRACPNLRHLGRSPAATSAAAATSNAVSGGSIGPGNNGIFARRLGISGHGLDSRRTASVTAAARPRSNSGSDIGGGGGGGGGQKSGSDAGMAAAAADEGADGEGGRSGGGAAAAVADSMIGRVEDTELYDETYKSYLSYAMSVIVSRAIPDVRDGLKPVHRRILYAMHELGLAYNKPFKKCARVVGEVLGKFHPHGDTAVYDSLVRMAQPFSMRQPLVDGHGNFGSLDDDPAAAMRYTECRLTRAAGESLLRDLGRDTVDWQPTFDESQSEPLVLPAVVPNLLVNGSAGIAVGLASNIPPHNLGEVVAALRALISDPGVTTEQLMQHVRGPDFPTGGEILVGPELLQAYDTGKGSVVVRGKATVERQGGGGGGGGADDGVAVAAAVGRGRRRRGAAAANATLTGEEGAVGGRREQIVITELPYQVFKSDLVAAIAELIESKQLEGASDVRDESDRTGVRVVVDVKKGHSGEAVLVHLYKSTKLQVNFNFNCMSLHNMKPRQMGLKAMLEAFLDFRCEVVQRRSSAALLAARQRLHLVEGFLRLLEEEGRLDAVVADVRAAADGAAARSALVSQHGLSEEQAEAILGLTLRRLTGLEAAKLQQEQGELQQTIARLQDILASRTALLAVVEQEAAALAEAYPDPRRTALVTSSDIPVHPDPEDLRPARPCLMLASRRGFLRRLPDEALAPQNRNTRGKSGIRLRSGDSLAALTYSSDRDMLLLLTPDGKMFKTRVASVPASAVTASAGSSASASASQTSSSGLGASAGPAGASVANVLKIPESSPIAALVPVPAGLLPATVVQSSPVGDGGAGLEPIAGACHEGDADGDDSAEVQGGEDGEAEVEAEAEAAQGPCLVLCSRQGLIKRLPLRNRRDRKKGVTVMGLGPRASKGTAAAATAAVPEELGWAALSTSPRDVVVLASAEGQLLLFSASNLRVSGPQSGGTQAMRISKRRPQDRIADMTVLPADLAPLLGMQLPAALAASVAAGDNGTALSAAGAAAEGVEDGGDDDDVVVAEEEEEEDISGEVSQPERQEEKEGEGATSGPAGPGLLIVTAHGIGKRIPLGQLRLGTRRQAGVVAIRVATAERARRSRNSSGAAAAAAAAVPAAPAPLPSRGPDRVVAVLAVRDGEEVVMASRNGVVVRQNVDGIAVQGRITRGTFVMQLDDGDEVVDVTLAAPPLVASSLSSPSPSVAIPNGAAGRVGGGRAVGGGGSRSSGRRGMSDKKLMAAVA